MKAAARDQHDLVARGEIRSEDRAASVGHDAHRTPRQLDVKRIDEPGQRRRLATAPRGSGIDTRLAPAGQKVLVPLAAEYQSEEPVAK